MSLIPDPARELTCYRCRIVVDTRMSRYVFLLLAWRGRDRGEPPADLRRILCGPCARELDEDLEQFLLGGDLSAFRKGVISCGRSLRERVAAEAARETDRGRGPAGYGGGGVPLEGLPRRVGDELGRVAERALGAGGPDGGG
jgi:hypothetical protein